jgi:hypothetical protein
MRCWFVKELSLLNAGEELIYAIPTIDTDVRWNTKSVGTVHAWSEPQEWCRKIMTKQPYHRVYKRGLGVVPRLVHTCGMEESIDTYSSFALVTDLILTEFWLSKFTVGHLSSKDLLWNLFFFFRRRESYFLHEVQLSNLWPSINRSNGPDILLQTSIDTVYMDSWFSRVRWGHSFCYIVIQVGFGGSAGGQMVGQWHRTSRGIHIFLRKGEWEQWIGYRVFCT